MKPELIIDAPILNQNKIWVKKVCKPRFDHPFHFHKLCEITWIEKGQGKMIIGDYFGEFSDGEVVVAGPELPHLWTNDRLSGDLEDKRCFTKAIGVYFPVELINNGYDDSTVLSEYNALIYRAERGIKFYGNTKKGIITRLKEVASTKGLAQMGSFLQIIHLMITSVEYKCLSSIKYKSSIDLNDMERFNNVYQYLFQNFHNDIMLSDIANICNMSPTAFCRYFKQKTEKTFTNFLNEIRIGHAKKLLLDDNNSINNIGYECGYNNPVNFFNFFKRITGQTPGEFRKQVHLVNNAK